MNGEHTNVMAQIADFVCRFSLEQAPSEAVGVARTCVQDLVGVTLAGAQEPVARLCQDWVAAEGATPRATVHGTRIRSSVANAALANGVAGHALDLDDVSLAIRGHPGVVVGSAVLAAAEAEGASGSQLLAAYLVGVETMVALGFGIGRTHYIMGWHATATLGTLGAAAAVARLYRLDAEHCGHALGIAVSLAAGMRCNFGTMTKPLHAGHASSRGAFAAALAARGHTASSVALESPVGFFSLFSRDANPGAVLERLGRTWGILSPGISFKRHACCYGTHHAIDAVLALRDEYELKADVIEHIDVLVAPGGMAALLYDAPNEGMKGKFSLPYTVASAAMDGAPTLKTFDDAAVRRPAVRALMERVSCREAPGPAVTGDDPRFAEVTVTLRDGRRLRRRVDTPKGGAAAPLTAAEHDAKFIDLASAGLGDGMRARAVLDVLHDLERLDDINILTRLLSDSDRETTT